MLNLIGEGITKGVKKALKEVGEEASEKAVSKVAKNVAKKTRAEIFTDTLKTLKGKYGDAVGYKLIDMYDDGKKLSTLSNILSGKETQNPLLMYHAVDSRKLADLADKIGNKMPNPSIQIIDPEKNVGGNFGDVILLGNKDMAFSSGKYGGLDTRKTNIYGRDIYSRRKPFVEKGSDGYNYFYPKPGINFYKDRVLATPENISKYMNKHPVRGSEGIAGPGAIAAQVTPQFKSLSDVIRSASDRLKPRDIVQKSNDEWDNTVFDAINKIRDAQDVNVDISNSEYLRAIQELLGNKRARASGFEMLPKDGYDVFKNETAKNELRRLAETGEWLPTDYFELKANRPISVSEFSGAILPEDFGTKSWEPAEQKVMEFLEENNIPIIDRYFVGADGSSAKGKEAIFRKLAKQDRLKTPYLLGLATLLGGGAMLGYNNKKEEE